MDSTHAMQTLRCAFCKWDMVTLCFVLSLLMVDWSCTLVSTAASSEGLRVMFQFAVRQPGESRTCIHLKTFTVCAYTVKQEDVTLVGQECSVC
jgi:hypothetical protein